MAYGGGDRDGGDSLKDIAKQFELPERQSKIDTLLKPSDQYCICKSSDSTRFMIACDNCEEWFHGDCVSIRRSESKRIKLYYCPPCRKNDPSLKILYRQPKACSSGLKNPDPSFCKELDGSAGTDLETTASATEGECDCGQCNSCIGIISTLKRPLDPAGSGSGLRGRRTILRSCSKGRGSVSRSRTRSKLNFNSNKVDEQSSGEEDYSSYGKKKEYKRKATETQTSTSRKSSQSNSKCLSILSGENDGLKNENASKPKSQDKKKVSVGGRTRIPTRKSSRLRKQNDIKSAPVNPDEVGDSEDATKEIEEDNGQCYWIHCVNAAKNDSKYCSDECGVKLATERLYKFLPNQIKNWNLTPTYAEEQNQKELAKVRTKIEEYSEQLSEWDKMRGELDKHIKSVEDVAWDEKAEGAQELPDEEGTVFCVTCGHEVPAKKCIKHMERCFNRCEGRTNFGSSQRTIQPESNPVFCDTYDRTHRTYCKRLKVLCAEHTKEPKIPDNKICGCPIVKNLVKFQPTDGPEICPRLKKNCNKHFSWERLWRAEIDLERARLWFKLDELLNKEKTILAALRNRAGVMSLLMNSTIDHDVYNKIEEEMEMKRDSCKEMLTETYETNHEKEGGYEYVAVDVDDTFTNDDAAMSHADATRADKAECDVKMSYLAVTEGPNTEDSLEASKSDDKIEEELIFKKPLPPTRKLRKGRGHISARP